jgi:hypothetical protein
MSILHSSITKLTVATPKGRKSYEVKPETGLIVHGRKADIQFMICYNDELYIYLGQECKAVYTDTDKEIWLNECVCNCVELKPAS